MFKQLVYALFLVILVGLSVFVLAENMTSNETNNSTELNYTNESISEPTTPQDTVSPINTILSMILEKTSFNKGEIMPITIKLTQEDNTPISNEDIYFFLDQNPIGDSPTNSEGIATAYFDTSTTNSGQYMLSAEYRGSDQYVLSFDYHQIDIMGENGEAIPEPTDNPPVDVPVITEQQTILTTQNSTDPDITPIQDCKQEKWTETIPIYDTCTQTYEQTTCSDEPINNSCETETISYNYECITGYETIEKSKDVCKTKSYIIKNKYTLNVEEYTCQTNKETGNIVTMICDSIYDGNGDGICTSGESCIKYEFNNNEYTKYEKNSREDFTESDESYFLNTITAEEVTE